MGKVIVTHTNCNVDVSIVAIGNIQGLILLEKDVASQVVRFYAASKESITRYCYAYGMATGTPINKRTVLIEKQDFTGYSFYAEYKTRADKNKDVAHSPQRGKAVLQHTNGNAIAVFTEQKNVSGYMTSLSVTMNNPTPNDTRLSWGECSHEYLHESAKRISLEQAMLLHPTMFLQGYFAVED